MTKKLYRSNDRVLGGVCAGIAEYLDFDPVAVRLAYAFLTLCTCFSGVLFYIVAWIVMPPKNLLQQLFGELIYCCNFVVDFMALLND